MLQPLLLLCHRIGISRTTVRALQLLSSSLSPHARFRELQGSRATVVETQLVETQLVEIKRWKGLLETRAPFGPFHWRQLI